MQQMKPNPSLTEISVTTDIGLLRTEMRESYGPLRYDRIGSNRAVVERRDRIWKVMDAVAASEPGLPAVLLKARLHEEIAAQFDPVVFRHSPFLFEMGMRPAENWGTPTDWNPSAWMVNRRQSICNDTLEWRRVWACHFRNEATPLKLWNLSVFDADHHCIGYTKMLDVGVNGVMEQIGKRRGSAADAAEAAFLDAAMQSCQALLTCAGRFAEAAERKLGGETDPAVRGFLTMAAAAARRVPAERPSSFHEALASLLFLREAMATLEGIGISVLGHLDRQLNGWYLHDLAEGCLTEEEAGDLLARWMIYTDVKFHVEDNTWPETSTCIELGGCDETGKPVFNELTRLVLKTHHRHRFINPKLNCRFGSSSPQEYLELLATMAVAGHNHFAFLNDDVLIPALVKSGRKQEHARLYVNGGCQEPMVEGYEHSAGAYYYLNMARVMDLLLRPLPVDALSKEMDPEVRALMPSGAVEPADFEAFYRAILETLAQVTRKGAAWAAAPGRRWSEVHPCPMFSATLHGCVESATDYTEGGAMYNPSGIALVGFGTVVDSLFAVKKAVYEEYWCSLAELRAAMAANWVGHEALRARCVRLSKYGHGDAEADALAAQFARDISSACSGLPNERGGTFVASLFVYYFFTWMAAPVRATPDGRRDGEWLSQGAVAGRLRPVDSIAAVLESVGRIDFIDFPANAVVDVQFPIHGATPATMVAVMRTFAENGGPTLQVNCVSPDQLRDAQKHPEQYPDLSVRISGLSARFVALDRPVQDEIISRALLAL